MKPQSIVLVACLINGLIACDSNAGRKENQLAKPNLPDSIALVNKQKQTGNTGIDQSFECTRGQAEPIVRNKYFPKTTFVLQPDSLTAIETVRFTNGDKLVVTNWGCEYYVLTFRFETARFKADTLNLKYWYAAAGKLINKAMPGIDAPLDIERGVRALTNYAASNVKHLKLGTEIDFGGDEIRDYVTLDTISAIQRNRFAVTISFVKGPL